MFARTVTKTSSRQVVKADFYDNGIEKLVRQYDKYLNNYGNYIKS